MNDKQMYILAIDQGTTSTRAIIFDHGGQIVATGQQEHEQILPRSGWVEHDPLEIWRNTRNVVGDALVEAEINRHQLAAVGITNQRETAVVWDKNTGEPVTTRSSGRTPALSGSATSWPVTRGPTSTRSGSVCRWRPTSPAPRSSGSSTTSTAPASGPKRGTCCSATPMPGCCGTSPAGPRGECTSPTSPTPHAPC